MYFENKVTLLDIKIAISTVQKRLNKIKNTKTNENRIKDKKSMENRLEYNEKRRKRFTTKG